MRILLITKSAPLPPTGGDRQRTDLLYRALHRLGSTDTFLYRAHEDLEAGVYEQLEVSYGLVGSARPVPRGAVGGWAMFRAVAPAVVDRLAHNFGSARVAYQPMAEPQRLLAEVVERQRYDLIVSRYMAPAAATAPWNHAPTIIDIDDYPPQVYSQRLAEEALNPVERAVVKRQLARVAKLLPPFLAHARHLWVANPADVPSVDHPSVSVLPNIPYETPDAVARVCPPHADSGRIAMIGSLSYQVNIDGLNFFLAKAWPIILAARPSARLSIVGHGLTDQWRSAWSTIPNVSVKGFVEDIHDAYADSSFCVVPLTTGGGTKIKVVEALSKGRTCVLMRHALRGYDHVLKHEESLLVADSAEQMAAACIRLIDEPGYRDRLAEHGRQAVGKAFSYDAFARIVEDSVRTVVG